MLYCVGKYVFPQAVTLTFDLRSVLPAPRLHFPFRVNTRPTLTPRLNCYVTSRHVTSRHITSRHPLPAVLATQAQHAIAAAGAGISPTGTNDNGTAAGATNGGYEAPPSPSNASSAEAARVVLEALAVARAGILGMREALARMPVGCHPLIFYQRVRPFLSGWKSNPTLPDGVLYEVCVGGGGRRSFFKCVALETNA